MLHPLWPAERASDPRGEGPVEEEALALVDEQREGVPHQVGQEDVGPAVAVEILEVAAHARDHGARLVGGHPGLEGHLRQLPVRAVAVQEVRRPVVGDEDVHPPVPVVVGDGDTHPLPEVPIEAGRGGDVGERAVAVVAQERVRQGLEDVRVAVDAVPLLSPAAPVVRVLGEGPLEVVRDEEVQPAVVVEIQEGRARLQGVARHRDARPGGHVGEAPVALVVVEHVVAVVRDQDVHVAVVVVVPDGHPLGVALDARAAQSRLEGHVDEPPAAGVAEEAIEGGRVRAHVLGRGRPVQEEKVHPAVVVVVEGGHRPAERLERVLHVGREVLLDEAHAPRFGFVDQRERGFGGNGGGRERREQGHEAEGHGPRTAVQGPAGRGVIPRDFGGTGPEESAVSAPAPADPSSPVTNGAPRGDKGRES